MLRGIFEITEIKRAFDPYHGLSEAWSIQKFRVSRQWPWQNWRSLTAFGIGGKVGMVFDDYKIREGKFEISMC